MASYTKPDERLSEDQLTAIITNAVPPYAYHGSPREWTWTRPSGVWHLNLVFAIDHGGPSMKARLDGNPSLLQVCVRTTRREVNAALRWLVLVDAIDRHPDDPMSAVEQ
jgi:hypothetical protein